MKKCLGRRKKREKKGKRKRMEQKERTVLLTESCLSHEKGVMTTLTERKRARALT